MVRPGWARRRLQPAFFVTEVCQISGSAYGGSGADQTPSAEKGSNAKSQLATTRQDSPGPVIRRRRVCWMCRIATLRDFTIDEIKPIQPGKSGNPGTSFKPGNSQRLGFWGGGNPSGKSKGRARFEDAFNEALISQCVRKKRRDYCGRQPGPGRLGRFKAIASGLHRRRRACDWFTR